MWRDDFDALRPRRGRAGRRRAGRRRRRAGLLRRQPHRRRRRSRSRVTGLRVAGEGDLLAQLDRLRKTLDAEGLFAPQKRLARPRAAAHDRRRHRRGRQGARRRARRACGAAAGQGRLVWAFAPVQDRHAAPRITARAAGPRGDRRGRRHRRRARRRLARRPLLLLRRDAVPHGRAARRAGHRVGRPPHRPHADRRRRRAVSCSTPTHAAESAVPVPLRARRAPALARRSRRRLDVHARGARCCTARRRSRGCRARPASTSRASARAPAPALREIRAAGRRRVDGRARRAPRARALVLDRKAQRGGARRARRDAARARSRSRSPRTIPQRTLERGYALVTDAPGEPVTSAAAARRRRRRAAALRRRPRWMRRSRTTMTEPEPT